MNYELIIKALESCERKTVFDDRNGGEFEIQEFDEELVHQALEMLYEVGDE